MNREKLLATLRGIWLWLHDLLRASPLAALFLVAFVVTIYLNPVKVGPAVWGVAKVSMGAYLGYWADRWVFRPADRPHLQHGIAQGTAWKRRTFIVGCGMVAMGLIQ